MQTFGELQKLAFSQPQLQAVYTHFVLLPLHILDPALHQLPKERCKFRANNPDGLDFLGDDKEEAWRLDVMSI
ncbi:hypothetical protein EYF80_042176 [Liparis tanakae]|uniref:Uncharacterized protein n=1 Tax=Liparis tanakae TaxID=230148 RepID=A0A4Z2G3J8_9TELE|nr:hypothetical protein EYF80_042176 [Liparis tanakae]